MKELRQSIWINELLAIFFEDNQISFMHTDFQKK